MIQIMIETGNIHRQLLLPAPAALSFLFLQGLHLPEFPSPATFLRQIRLEM
jgi:hypothetical protein